MLETIIRRKWFLKKRETYLSLMLEGRILKNNPDGILARDREIWRVFRILDPDSKMPELEAFLKRFPVEKFCETETSGMYPGKIFQSMIYQPVVKRNDCSQLYKYIHDVSRGMLFTFYWHMVQEPLNTSQRTPENVIVLRCNILL